MSAEAWPAGFCLSHNAYTKNVKLEAETEPVYKATYIGSARQWLMPKENKVLQPHRINGSLY
jgi:hypothetical protein